MNFNSVVFLFCFMPLALGLYYLVPGRVKNAVLLVESLLFFCWGGITWLPLAVGMVAINYAAGLLLASLPAGGKRRWSTANTRTFCWTRSTLSLPPGLPS